MLKSIRLVLLCAVFALPSWSADHANFGGTWKLRTADSQPVTWSEVYTFEHDGTWLRVIQRIDDSLGKRVLDVSGTLDGKPHRQMVAGSPCTFTGKWEDDGKLTWETRRETPNMVLFNRRTMGLSPDGKVLIARRTRLSPAPEETAIETWERPAVGAQPDFSGTWQLQNRGGSETYTFEHDSSWFRVVMKIEGASGAGVLGTRTLDVSGAIDGVPHRQTVQGFPCTFIAQWDAGGKLTWETRRETSAGVLHYRRTMQLSEDGDTITAQWTQISPKPEGKQTEIWRRIE
ncbi:MAG: hypothetical protein WBL65_00175 [Bryobacteraceae bacterium]